MNSPLKKEIFRRINVKNSKYRCGVKSITLGINVYNELCDEVDSLGIALYAINGKYSGPELFGYPIRIAYRRKNLIQINVKRPRPKKYKWIKNDNPYITIDYFNNLNTENAFFDTKLLDELKAISIKYPVSFLTSRQKDVNIGL